MIERIKIQNFKCFSSLEVELRPLTLLCGVNSGGKSSVLQAALMALEAMEDGREEGILDLMNSRYNAELYSFTEILYEDSEEDEIKVELYEDGQTAELFLSSMEDDNNLFYQIRGERLPERKIWYLSSERMISKYQRRGNAGKLELGRENEYIAYILERGRSPKIEIDKGRSYQDKETALFADQVNQWLDYILPGNQVMGTAAGNDNMVSLTFGKNHRLHRTNVGYGVGFVLPMIVGGLLAKAGDILMIENPELHLHPKAQSNLSLFLATVACGGVQVLVETHSDHIVNGMRKAVVNPDCGLGAADAGIYYFDDKNNVMFLTLDESAHLSDWPEDFMEQVEKDLRYLRKMRTVHGN